MTAILRLEGHRGTAVGVIQFVPTVALVIALALLLEVASSGHGPAASDNASGVRWRSRLPAHWAPRPRGDVVEVVLQGAGDSFGIGLRTHLGARRGTVPRRHTVVLGIAASGAGLPHWWPSDGPLVPLRYFNRLARLCAQAAGDDPTLESHARTRSGRRAGVAGEARPPPGDRDRLSRQAGTGPSLAPRHRHRRQTRAAGAGPRFSSG